MNTDSCVGPPLVMLRGALDGLLRGRGPRRARGHGRTFPLCTSNDHTTARGVETKASLRQAATLLPEGGIEPPYARPGTPSQGVPSVSPRRVAGTVPFAHEKENHVICLAKKLKNDKEKSSPSPPLSRRARGADNVCVSVQRPSRPSPERCPSKADKSPSRKA